MKKYKTGLVIGRFQPFHNGHLYLLRKALDAADTIVIGLGSANLHDGDNPLSVSERRTLLRRVIKKEEIEKRIKKITVIDDGPDAVWLKEVLQKVGEIDVVIGNTEWTNRVFQEEGYPILLVPFWKRFLYEGKRIRHLIKREGAWQNRVPEYLVSDIEEMIGQKSLEK